MHISINGLSINTVIYELRFNMCQDRDKAQRFTDNALQKLANAQAEEKCLIMGIDFAPALTAYLPIDVSTYNKAARIAYDHAETADKCVARLRLQGEQCLNALQNEFNTRTYVEVDQLEVKEIFIALYMNAKGGSSDLKDATKSAWDAFNIMLDQAISQCQWDSTTLTTLDIDFSKLFSDENEENQLLDVTTYDQKMLAQGKKTAEACIEILYQRRHEETSHRAKHSDESISFDNDSHSAVNDVEPPLAPAVMTPPTATIDQSTRTFNHVEPFQLEIEVMPVFDQRSKTLSDYFKSSRT